jgi:hypothetical protein
MTNSDLQEGVLASSGDLEDITDEVFTRPRSRLADLKDLQAVAFDLFYGKNKGGSGSDNKTKELSQLVEIIALVVSKTYVERGDSFALADDEALTLIRDLLLRYNPSVVARNKNKRLPKHLFL